MPSPPRRRRTSRSALDERFWADQCFVPGARMLIEIGPQFVDGIGFELVAAFAGSSLDFVISYLRFVNTATTM